MKKKVLSKVTKDDIVFDIIEVKSLTDGDLGMKLINDFRGVVGVLFY